MNLPPGARLEEPGRSGNATAGQRGDGLTALHCETWRRMKSAGVQLSTCLAIVPEMLDPGYLKAYQIRKLAECVDFVFIMA
jgi:spore germination protein YaaH